jgi:leucyl-tRNA synthetase
VYLSAWPPYDASLAAQDHVTLVVQVDGKVRDRIEVSSDVTEEQARALALASENARRALGEREIAKVIVRPPKLVNIVASR